MKVLKVGNWKKKIVIPDLLNAKGCDAFTLLKDDLMAKGQHFEIWWYAYGGKNHIVAKNKQYPYRLYFLLLETGDLFSMMDFKSYLETGDLDERRISRRDDQNGGGGDVFHV